jgi:MFS family permease
LSTFVVGIAIGTRIPLYHVFLISVLFGPLSEFYGRKPVYIVSYFLFLGKSPLDFLAFNETVWQIPTALAKNIATIIITRFLAGFSGSAFLSVAGGSITDMWIKEQVAWPMAIYTIGAFLGPTIGPLVGGFINQHVSWRWTFYVTLMWAGTEVPFPTHSFAKLIARHSVPGPGNLCTCYSQEKSQVS